MAALPPNTVDATRWSEHRVVSGAPVAADAAPSGAFPSRSGLLNAKGYDTILASVRLEGGAAPTVTLQPLVYDEDLDDFAKHALTGALSDGDTVELLVVGGRAFLRIEATAGNPTKVQIRIKGGQASPRLEH